MKKLFRAASRILLSTIFVFGFTSCASPLGQVDPGSRAAWMHYRQESPVSTIPGDDTEAGVSRRTAALRQIAQGVQHGLMRHHIEECARWYDAIPRVAAAARKAYGDTLREYGALPPLGRGIGRPLATEPEDDGWNGFRRWFGGMAGEFVGTAIQRSLAADARNRVIRPYAEHLKDLSREMSFINRCLGIPDSPILAERMAAMTPRPVNSPVRVQFSGGFSPRVRLRIR